MAGTMCKLHLPVVTKVFFLLSPILSSQQGDLHINLDLDYYDSEEELDGDSDNGDFSDSDDDFDSDVTLEELAQGGLDIPKGQGNEKFPQRNVKGSDGSNGASMAVVPAGESSCLVVLQHSQLENLAEF